MPQSDHVARLDVRLCLIIILVGHEQLGSEHRCFLARVQDERLLVIVLLVRVLENVKEERRLVVEGLDAEEVVEVHNLADLAGGRSWLEREPALLSGLAQVHLAAAVLQRHLLEVEGEVVAAEQVLELHRLPVSDLLAQLQLLIVLIVLLLVLLEQQHLRDVLVNLLYLLLDFDQRRLAHLLFASLLLDELLEALRRLLLLFEQLPLPQIGAAVLLDFDSEEALFEAIAAVLAQVIHLWDHFDALIGDAIRVEHAFVDEVRLRKAP
jgi:hypothetical protein